MWVTFEFLLHFTTCHNLTDSLSVFHTRPKLSLLHLWNCPARVLSPMKSIHPLFPRLVSPRSNVENTASPKPRLLWCKKKKEKKQPYLRLLFRSFPLPLWLSSPCPAKTAPPCTTYWSCKSLCTFNLGFRACLCVPLLCVTHHHTMSGWGL